MPEALTTTANPFLPYRSPAAPDPVYRGVRNTLDSAFELYNDVVNITEYVTRQQFPSDPSFRIGDAAQSDPLFLDNMWALSRANSQAEYDSIEGRIKTEHENQRVLAGAGRWGGIAAGLVAGVLSPTMFIPLTGTARGVKGVAQAFALAGAAGTAQEAALWVNSETMSAGDFGRGVAAQTVLGGLLGGAAVYLKAGARARIEREWRQAVHGTELPPVNLAKTAPGEFIKVYDAQGETVSVRVESGMRDGKVKVTDPQGVSHELGEGTKGDLEVPRAVPEPEFEIIPAHGGGVGAELRDTIPPVRIRGENAALTAAFRHAGPFGELLTATRKDLRTHIIDGTGAEIPNPELGKNIPLNETSRQMTVKLGNAGLGLDQSVMPGASTKGGTVEARRNLHEAQLLPVNDALDTAYADHVFGSGGGPEHFRIGLASLRSLSKRLPEGKLTKAQFDEEVMNAVNANGGHSLSEVRDVAETLSNMFAHFEQKMREYHVERQAIDGEQVEPLFHVKEATEGAENPGYFNRIYDQIKVQSESFNQLLEDTFSEQLQGVFHKLLERHTKSLVRFKTELEKKGVKGTEAYGTYYNGLGGELRTARAALKKLGEAPDPVQELALQNRITELLQQRQLAKWAASGKEAPEFTAEQLQKELYADLAETLGKTVEELGGTDIHIEAGVANFAEIAKDIARHVAHTIRGDSMHVSGMRLLTGRRGSTLSRMLDIPYAKIKPFLVLNPEQLARIYIRNVGTDLELYRMFGSVNGAKQLEQISHEFDNLAEQVSKQSRRPSTRIEKLQKKGSTQPAPDYNDPEVLRLRAEQKRTLDTLQVLITRLRHTRSIPSEGAGVAYRAGRFTMNAQVAGKMGMVALSSIQDPARPVFKFGLMKTFKDAWVPFTQQSAKWKFTTKHARFMAIALDPLTHNRNNAIFALFEHRAIGQGKIETGMEFLANKIGAFALFDQWTALMKHLAFSVASAEFSRAFRIVHEGGQMKPMYRAMLADGGLTDDLIRRVWKEMNTGEGGIRFDDEIMFNTEAWTDTEAATALGAAMNKIVEMDMIITPGIGLPKWMDKNIGFKMLGQFRSFTAESYTKMLLTSVQDATVFPEQRMAVLQGTLFSLALGTVSYYLSAAAAGGSRWEKAKSAPLGTIADEAIDRSGLLGWLNEGMRIAEQFPATHDYVRFGDRWTTRRSPEGPLGAMLGPSYDLMKRISTLSMAIDSPTKSTVHTMRTLLPYNNIFWARQGYTAVEKAAQSFFPKRRTPAKKKKVVTK